MNRNDALKTLELKADATDEEIKKQFRKLAAKYHPDRNKDIDAEDKFKAVNSAHSFLTEVKSQPQQYSRRGSPLDDFFQHMRREANRKPFISQAVTIPLTLNFKESVKGCKKHITYKYYDQCSECEGFGGKQQSENCITCNGRGTRAETIQQGNGLFTVMHPCQSCSGSGKKTDKCSVCDGSGVKQSEKSLDVTIPGGVQNGQTIRLSGQGSWQSLPTFCGYSDAFISINVTPDSDMRLQGIDVISGLEIDLLTALKGGKKQIKTVDYDLDITIPKGARHKDKICLAGHGAVVNGGVGSHIVELNVKYPDDLDKLVEKIEKE